MDAIVEDFEGKRVIFSVIIITKDKNLLLAQQIDIPKIRIRVIKKIHSGMLPLGKQQSSVFLTCEIQKSLSVARSWRSD